MTQIFMPVLPQCSCWPNGYKGGQCKESATVWLIAPDGKRNPGGYTCRSHGEAIVKEYAQKLGEQWTLAEITAKK